ncbi:MAG: WD40 repeat domain-containing protein, partial [Gemmataceae bacterium]
LTPEAEAASRSLIEATLRGVMGSVPERVAALAAQALGMAAVTKLKIGLALGLLLGVAAGGVAMLTPQAPMAPISQAERPVDPPKAEDAKPARRVDRHGDPLPPGALVRLGTVRLRQQGRSFAFSPDSKRIASTCSDGFVRIWDAATGQERRRLDGFGFPNRLAFSPNGKLLAVVDEQALDIHLWDTATGKRIRKWSRMHDHGLGFELITGLTFSPDSKILAADEENVGITLWDTATGDKIGLLDACKNYHTIAFLPDGKNLLVSNSEGVVELWNMRGRQLRKFNTGNTNQYAHAVSADGKTLVLGAVRGETAGLLSVWDIATGKERRRLETQAPVMAAALSPDGKALAYIQDTAKVIQLRDMDSWQEGRRLKVVEGNARDLAFSPDGKALAARVENALELWDVATGRPLASRPGHVTAVDRLAFTADGRQLLSITRNQQLGTARLWDTLTGQYLSMLPEDWDWTDYGVVCPSRDGAMLLLGGYGTITLWDVAKHRRVREFAVEEKSADKSLPLFIYALALSPDGRRMTAISADGKGGVVLLVWDVASGAKRSRRTFVLPKLENGLQHFYRHLSLSPDGRMVANTDGRTVWVRDVVSGMIWRTLHWEKPAANEKIGTLVFSNDGRLLASLSSANARASTKGKVRIWDLVTGVALPPLADPWALSIAFAPDSRLLATAGAALYPLPIREQPIRLWDLATGKEVERFEGHGTLAGSLVTRTDGGALAFSADGQMLATGLMDSTVLLWDVKPALRRLERSLPAVRRGALPRLWADLAGADAGKAFAARWTLAAAPDQALPLLRERLKPAQSADPQRLRRLLADLESDQFTVREKAQEELAKLSDLAEPALRKTLTGKPTLEVRRRVQVLLERLRGPVTRPELLRSFRAVAVLEDIGMPKARRVLQELAKGAPEARLSREAKAALQRLDLRRPHKP